MGTIFFIIALLAIAGYFFLNRSRQVSTPPTREATSSRQAGQDSENLDWMMEAWKKADLENAEGKLISFPRWFFDDPTPRQMEKLATLNVNLKNGTPTKGQASDLIGLFNPADEYEDEVLRFFKIPGKGMNQTKAHYVVGGLLSDPEKRFQWESRPATTEQKEFFRFFGIKAPANLSVIAAEEMIGEVKNQTVLENPTKLEEWGAYETILGDMSDKEMLKDEFEIKKPSLALIREAIAALIQEGRVLTELESYDVAEKIEELKPDIARAIS